MTVPPKSDDDPWIVRPNGADLSSSDQRTFLSRIIETVKPFDPSSGMVGAKTVPDALYIPLFGGIKPKRGDSVAGISDPTAIPQMQTYAVLDAGKFQNLPDRLRMSGLDHRCLFQGASETDHGDVAPWIVQLEEGKGFTRSLFSAGDIPENLWRFDPGIFIRSPASLDEMRRHFRKFTRVQDEHGKWFFFRFWEGWHFHVLAQRQEQLPELSRLFSRILGDGVAVVPHTRLEQAVLLRNAQKPQAGRFILTDTLRAEIRLAVFYRNMLRSAFNLHEDHPIEAKRYGDKPQDLWPLLCDFADEVRAAGLRDPRLRARLMLLAFLRFPEPWPAFINQPFWQKIRATPERADDLFEDFCSQLKYLNARNGTAESIWW